MKFFTKHILRNLALSALSAVALSACGGAGSCTNCNTVPSGNLTLSIAAPSQYPAGVAITAYLTMTNTSTVNGTNLVYSVPTLTNYTGVEITINPTGAGQDCATIVAGASCTFTAIIPAGSKPGSFTVLATPSGSATQVARTNQGSKSLQADSISVTANLGLVDIPNTSNEYYILPSDQVVIGSATQATTAYVSVWIKQGGNGLNSLKLVDETGYELSYIPVGVSNYTVNSVNSYKITIPAGKTLQHVQALSNTCTILNIGTNNNSSCSNDADINLVQSGVGILAIQPNYFQMTESHESQVVTLQNVGVANITGLQLPTLATPFSLEPGSNTCNSSLASGASCKLTLIYTPSTISGQDSFVVNYNNGASVVNTTATIQYVGTAPANYAILTTSPASFSLSESHSVQRITLTNTGTAEVTSLTLPTLTAPLVESTTNCTNTLAVNASCAYDVYINYAQSVTAGAESITFTYHNGLQNQTSNVAADWSVLPATYATLTASPTSFSLSESHPTQRIMLTNSGTAAATNLILPSLVVPLVESTTSCSSTLAINDSCSYDVYIDYSQPVTAGEESVTFVYNNGQQIQMSNVVVDWSGGTVSLSPSNVVNNTTMTYTTQTSKVISSISTNNVDVIVAINGNFCSGRTISANSSCTFVLSALTLTSITPVVVTIHYNDGSSIDFNVSASSSNVAEFNTDQIRYVLIRYIWGTGDFDIAAGFQSISPSVGGFPVFTTPTAGSCVGYDCGGTRTISYNAQTLVSWAGDNTSGGEEDALVDLWLLPTNTTQFTFGVWGNWFGGLGNPTIMTVSFETYVNGTTFSGGSNHNFVPSSSPTSTASSATNVTWSGGPSSAASLSQQGLVCSYLSPVASGQANSGSCLFTGN